MHSLDLPEVSTTLFSLLLLFLFLGLSTLDITTLILLLKNRVYGLCELITNSHSFWKLNLTSLEPKLTQSFLLNNLPPLSIKEDPIHPHLSTHNQKIYYPGLINSSSNLCFLNAVLQSLASMPHVIDYLEMIQSYGVSYTPVASALREMLVALNTPRAHQAVLKPFSVAQALLGHPAGRRSMLFNSEQQDAQEFLVTMIDALEAEAQLLADHLRRYHHSVHPDPLDRHLFCSQARTIRTSPFRGLLAHRIACATCGFTSVIRHASADHFSLNVPPKTTCRLESCLEEYTKLEVLDEYVCRKCSLMKTHEGLSHELDQLQHQPLAPKASSKKKQVQAIRKKLGVLKAAIEEDPERELGAQIAIQRVASTATTKQTMFARPPKSLTFHISRSTAYARGVSFKNHCQVSYPELLVLDPFCTTSALTGDAALPISPHAPGSSAYCYRLSSVVVHFGSHSFGHYITFRKSPSASSTPLDRPKVWDDELRTCPRHTAERPGAAADGSGTGAKEEEDKQLNRSGMKTDCWYRISDETVQPTSVEEALRANPFMLMYERIDRHPHSHPGLPLHTPSQNSAPPSCPRERSAFQIT